MWPFKKKTRGIRLIRDYVHRLRGRIAFLEQQLSDERKTRMTFDRLMSELSKRVNRLMSELSERVNKVEWPQGFELRESLIEDHVRDQVRREYDEIYKARFNRIAALEHYERLARAFVGNIQYVDAKYKQPPGEENTHAK